MNIRKQIHQLAAENAVKIIDEDSNRFLLTVPVSGERRQQVKAEIIRNSLYNRDVLRFSSAVSIPPDGDGLAQLLIQSAYFHYCRFSIREGMLWVEAITPSEDSGSRLLNEMLTEVANLADQYEKRLTGSDTH